MVYWLMATELSIWHRDRVSWYQVGLYWTLRLSLPFNVQCGSVRSYYRCNLYINNVLYEGPSDNVRCFYCDGGLKHWQPNDDPWTEHRRWFPRCPYVIEHGSQLPNPRNVSHVAAAPVCLQLCSNNAIWTSRHYLLILLVPWFNNRRDQV